jgi:AraC family transcriptional regulator of arabinose operon
MKIPANATSYCPPVRLLLSGTIRRRNIRHTFRPKGTRDWLLIYTVSGSGLYRFDGGEYRSRTGDITLYRPGFFQDYRYAPEGSGWDLLFAHFFPRPEWVSWLNWPEIAPGLMKLSLHDPALRRRCLLRLNDMIRLNSGSHARGPIFGLNALEEVVLWCDSINPARASSRIDPRVRKAMEFISLNLAEPFSEERLARLAGLSPSRFRHLFREQVGDSPRNFQEQKRLQCAGDMLALSRQTIGEIAQELGFANPFYFTLRFKKHSGESPSAFRRRTAGK